MSGLAMMAYGDQRGGGMPPRREAAKAPGAARSWTADDIATAQRMVLDGAAPEAIAEALGRPLYATKKKLTTIRKPLVAAMRVQTNRWTPLDISAATEILRGGGTTEDVVKALPGRTRAAVKVACVKLRRRMAQEAGASRKVAAMMKIQPGPPDPAPMKVTVQGKGPVSGVPRACPAPEAVAGAAGAPVMPGWWRDIEEALDALNQRDPWRAQDDLQLVEGLARWGRSDVVAAQLRVPARAVEARFIALTPHGVTIEGQQRLLQVLRERVNRSGA